MKIKTPEFRVSFPAIFKPQDFGNQDKYGLVMLFPKDADLSVLKQAAEQVAKDKWPEGVPAGLKNPFHDQASKQYAGYEAGAIYVNVRSNRRPGLIDENYQEITSTDEFYAGCWARATVTASAYDSNGSKGVTFYLNNIMKIRDDKRLDGGKSALEDFAPPEQVAELQETGAGASAGSIFD